MSSERISVAMTSYNGEKYILKQLESIRTQTRCPDEVIILDDQSSDNTVAVVNSFITKNRLAGWSIKRNESNLGWKRNFYEVAKQTSGDIVFFSDQDDIWLPDKIEKMSSLMREKNMGALYGEKLIIDSDGKIHEERMEKTSFSGKAEQITFTKSFYAIKTLGCCMCVSREVVNKYIELNFPQGGHDSQCGRIAVLYSSLWHIDEPVIQYRIHSNNTSGISSDVSFGASTLEKRIQGIESQRLWLSRLNCVDKEKNEIIKSCITAVEKRENYLRDSNGVNFFSLLKYREFYTGITMLIGDFSYKHSINKLMGQIRWKFRKIK